MANGFNGKSVILDTPSSALVGDFIIEGVIVSNPTAAPVAADVLADSISIAKCQVGANSSFFFEVCGMQVKSLSYTGTGLVVSILVK